MLLASGLRGGLLVDVLKKARPLFPTRLAAKRVHLLRVSPCRPWHQLSSHFNTSFSASALFVSSCFLSVGWISVRNRHNPNSSNPFFEYPSQQLLLHPAFSLVCPLSSASIPTLSRLSQIRQLRSCFTLLSQLLLPHLISYLPLRLLLTAGVSVRSRLTPATAHPATRTGTAGAECVTPALTSHFVLAVEHRRFREEPPDPGNSAPSHQNRHSRRRARFREEPPQPRQQRTQPPDQALHALSASPTQVTHSPPTPTQPDQHLPGAATSGDGQQDVSAVDAVAGALLARSRALLRERDQIQQRIQAALSRFTPPSHAPPKPMQKEQQQPEAGGAAPQQQSPPPTLPLPPQQHEQQQPLAQAAPFASASHLNPSPPLASKPLELGRQQEGLSWRQRLKMLLHEVDRDFSHPVTLPGAHRSSLPAQAAPAQTQQGSSNNVPSQQAKTQQEQQQQQQQDALPLMSHMNDGSAGDREHLSSVAGDSAGTGHLSSADGNAGNGEHRNSAVGVRDGGGICPNWPLGSSSSGGNSGSGGSSHALRSQQQALQHALSSWRASVNDSLSTSSARAASRTDLLAASLPGPSTYGSAPGHTTLAALGGVPGTQERALGDLPGARERECVQEGPVRGLKAGDKDLDAILAKLATRFGVPRGLTGPHPTQPMHSTRWAPQPHAHALQLPRPPAQAPQVDLGAPCPAEPPPLSPSQLPYPSAPAENIIPQGPQGDPGIPLSASKHPQPSAPTKHAIPQVSQEDSGIQGASRDSRVQDGKGREELMGQLSGQLVVPHLQIGGASRTLEGREQAGQQQQQQQQQGESQLQEGPQLQERVQLLPATSSSVEHWDGGFLLHAAPEAVEQPDQQEQQKEQQQQQQQQQSACTVPHRSTAAAAECLHLSTTAKCHTSQQQQQQSACTLPHLSTAAAAECLHLSTTAECHTPQQQQQQSACTLPHLSTDPSSTADQVIGDQVVGDHREPVEPHSPADKRNTHQEQAAQPGGSPPLPAEAPALAAEASALALFPSDTPESRASA
ncbi:hypothetical protein DUNSADRAFT_1332, partial [Dunaliella salina]